VAGTAALPLRAVEEVRRRWLFLLVAFTAASLFSGGWELFRGFEARAFSQGAGLALLAALPLYAGGLLLASPALARVGGRLRETDGSPAPPAFFGAALGFLLLGHLFFPALSPTAVLLLAIVATSGGALVHGWLLDEVAQVEVGGSGTSLVRIRTRRARPPVTRLGWLDRSGALVVREGGGGPALDRDRALEGALLGLLPPPSSVLVLGWRALPAALASSPEAARLRVVDPDPARPRELLEGMVGGTARRVVEISAAGETGAPHDGGTEAVPLHDRIFTVVGGGLSGEGEDPDGWTRLRASLAPGGTVVLLDVPEGGGESGGFLEALRAGAEVLGSAVGYLGPAEDAVPGAGGGPPVAGPGARSGFILAGGVEPLDWPDRVGAFARIQAAEVGVPALGGGGDPPDGEEGPEGAQGARGVEAAG
jgi:hypothetical protein